MFIIPSAKILFFFLKLYFSLWKKILCFFFFILSRSSRWSVCFLFCQFLSVPKCIYVHTTEGVIVNHLKIICSFHFIDFQELSWILSPLSLALILIRLHYFGSKNFEISWLLFPCREVCPNTILQPIAYSSG